MTGSQCVRIQATISDNILFLKINNTYIYYTNQHISWHNLFYVWRWNQNFNVTIYCFQVLCSTRFSMYNTDQFLCQCPINCAPVSVKRKASSWYGLRLSYSIIVLYWVCVCKLSTWIIIVPLRSHDGLPVIGWLSSHVIILFVVFCLQLYLCFLQTLNSP